MKAILNMWKEEVGGILRLISGRMTQLRCLGGRGKMWDVLEEVVDGILTKEKKVGYLGGRNKWDI